MCRRREHRAICCAALLGFAGVIAGVIAGLIAGVIAGPRLRGSTGEEVQVLRDHTLSRVTNAAERLCACIGIAA